MNTATHFKAHQTKDEKGFAIVLYRFKSNDRGDERPQYLGPMGWHFHSATKDEDVIPKLLPIEKLEEVTGDNIEKEIWKPDNIYAG